MAKEKEEPKKPLETKPDEMTQVPTSLLLKMQEDMAQLQIKVADEAAARAGLEELVNSKPSEEGGKLREKKNFEPEFRTVRLRKYPMAGDHTNPGYVVGWTNRGAYQEVDRSGVTPQFVDFIDVIFLDHERNVEGKLQVEKIRVMDLLTKGEQVKCKVQKMERKEIKIPTGEEIDVTVFDPAHGMTATGDVIDGYVTMSDIMYTIEIPGRAEPVEIDATYIN